MFHSRFLQRCGTARSSVLARDEGFVLVVLQLQRLHIDSELNDVLAEEPL
jgi:hypothetical protein